MPDTGYVHATTPGNLGLGSGIVEIDTGAGFAVFSATRGAPRFTPGEEWRTPEIDGLSAPPAGTDRRVYTEATLEFTSLEFTAAKQAQLMPGSTSVTATGTTTITPVNAGVYIAEGALYAWRVTWRKGDNTLFSVTFPKGFPVIGGIGAADRAEGDQPITIRSRLFIAGATTVDSAPYTLAFRPAA